MLLLLVLALALAVVTAVVGGAEFELCLTQRLRGAVELFRPSSPRILVRASLD